MNDVNERQRQIDHIKVDLDYLEVKKEELGIEPDCIQLGSSSEFIVTYQSSRLFKGEYTTKVRAASSKTKTNVFRNQYQIIISTPQKLKIGDKVQLSIK